MLLIIAIIAFVIFLVCITSNDGTGNRFQVKHAFIIGAVIFGVVAFIAG